MAGEGQVRWNPDTQSWDSGGPQAGYTPPPPPRPEHAPASAPAPAQGGQYPSWPPPVPEPGPRPWFRRQVVVAGATVAVLAAVVGGIFLWGRGEGTPAHGQHSPSTSPLPTSLEPGSGPETTGSSSAAPPLGYERVAEDEFSIVVPEGWQRRTEAGQNGVTLYFYEAAEGPQRVQVFQVSEPDAAPMHTLELAEGDLESLPGYERNSLGAVSDERGEAAELDYSYDSKEWGTRLRVLDRITPAAPGDPALYAVLSIGPADEWPKQQEVQEEAVTSFAVPQEAPQP